MLITLNIDTALLSRQDYADARHLVSYIEGVRPDWCLELKRCPVIVELAKPTEQVIIGLPLTVENGEVVAGTPVAEPEQPATGPEAGDVAPKPRRGRKPKEEASVAPVAPIDPVPGEPIAPFGLSAPSELEALLEKFNKQMIEGELADEKRTPALEKWRARGEEGIPELKTAINANEEFLAKKRAAKAEANKVNAAATPATPAAAGDPEKFTLDVLRANMKMYSEKHGLEKGEELLKKFGCNRVSEMENKTAAQQDEFMTICRGRVDA